MLLGLRRGPWRAVSAPLPRNGASRVVASCPTCGGTRCRSAARHRAGAAAASRSARMRNRTLPFLAAVALGIALARPPTPALAQDKTITVFAAASLKNALDDVDAAFAKSTG